MERRRVHRTGRTCGARSRGPFGNSRHRSRHPSPHRRRRAPRAGIARRAARGAGDGDRSSCASSWKATAAGMPCEPFDVGAAAVAGHPLQAGGRHRRRNRERGRGPGVRAPGGADRDRAGAARQRARSRAGHTGRGPRRGGRRARRGAGRGPWPRGRARSNGNGSSVAGCRRAVRPRAGLVDRSAVAAASRTATSTSSPGPAAARPSWSRFPRRQPGSRATRPNSSCTSATTVASSGMGTCSTRRWSRVSRGRRLGHGRASCTTVVVRTRRPVGGRS